VKESDTNSSGSGARVPKQQRALETQEKILVAALAVFAERGYDGTTMGRVAKRAGVGQPLVVYHFPTKEDLWVAAAEMALDKFMARLLPNLEALEGLDPAIRLSLIFQDYTRFSAGIPALLQIFIDMNRRGGPALDRVITDRLRPTYDRLRQLIEAAQRAGAMPAGDPGLIYYALISVAVTLFSLNREFELLTGRDPKDPDMVEAQASLLARLFFPGLADADAAGGQ
jgi:TetR/AcrR family transcriptional regulator